MENVEREHTIEEIEKLNNEGRKPSEIAKVVGLNESTVRALLTATQK